MKERIPEFSATKKDFKVDWFSGTGAGGQYRNKHQNSCRITHLPTGITAVCQDYRERLMNQKTAFSRLAKRLIAHHKVEQNKEDYISNERVRTYHEPRNDVLDHASGLHQSYKYVVEEGNIADMIDARRQAMVEKLISK